MKVEKAIKTVLEFKGNSLRQHLGELKHNLVGKNKSEIISQKKVYEAALVVKKISAQINEIVHATGIINCLPQILESDEVIESLSLAAGAEGEGIDLITNLRIAEFKFSEWQDAAANGARKRHVFADCVNLLLKQTDRKKELYVVGADTIRTYFFSKRAKWRNALSKSGGLDKKLESYLNQKAISAESVYDIFKISGVTLFDVDDFLN